MDRELIERLALSGELCGEPDEYSGKGDCQDPDCRDTLCYFIRSSRDMVSDIRYTITQTSCPPSKACAAACARLAVSKPLLAAYLIDDKQIAGEVGGLDQEYVHCAMMAELALKRAVLDCIKNRKGE